LPFGKAENEEEAIVLSGFGHTRGKREHGHLTEQVTAVARDHMDQIVHIAQTLSENPGAPIFVVRFVQRGQARLSEVSDAELLFPDEASILTSERPFGQSRERTKIRKDRKESFLFLKEAASDRICEHASERPLELSGVEGSHEAEDDLRISSRSGLAKLLV
jgi:hypothetical protein